MLPNSHCGLVFSTFCPVAVAAEGSVPLGAPRTSATCVQTLLPSVGRDPSVDLYWIASVILQIIGLFPVQLNSLHCARHPMVHVDVTLVLMSSPLISSWSLRMLFPLLMTEVVTPSGKGCSYGMLVATEIRSRVQLFVDQGIDYLGLRLVVWFPWERMRHLDLGLVRWWGCPYLLGAVDWIAVICTHKKNERGGSFRSCLVSGPVYAFARGSGPGRTSLTRPKKDSSCIYIRLGSMSKQKGMTGSQAEWRYIPQL